MSQPFILRTDNARQRMAAAWQAACRFLELGRAVKVTVDEVKPTRTLDQNAKLWAVLTDISRQVEWHVDGRMQKLEPEDWKDILSAGVTKSQRVAAGIEGASPSHEETKREGARAAENMKALVTRFLRDG